MKRLWQGSLACVGMFAGPPVYSASRETTMMGNYAFFSLFSWTWIIVWTINSILFAWLLWALIQYVSKRK